MLTNKNKIDFAVSNFNELELKLIDCMTYVPYINQNSNTISPKFIPIILEACSLIESIFKESIGCGKYTFKDYSKKLESELCLSDSISILLTSPIIFLEPYKNWETELPDWWDIYNKVKHDRLNNFHLITYNSVMMSLAALHLLISKNRIFTNHLMERNWIPSNQETLSELFSARMINDNCIPIKAIPCESKLFVSPLGNNFVIKDKNCFKVDNNCLFSAEVNTKIVISEFNL